MDNNKVAIFNEEFENDKTGEKVQGKMSFEQARSAMKKHFKILGMTFSHSFKF